MESVSANIAVVAIDGDLDVAAVPRFRTAIDRLIDDGCKRMVLNMAGVQYVDSSGVGLIVHAIRRMRSCGGLLSLINVQDAVYRMLRLARIVDFAPVSVAGPRPEVPELPPQAQSLWRTSFEVQPSEMHEARERVGCLLARLPFTRDEIFDVTLATGEAMGNAVDHAGGMVMVSVAAYDDRAVVEVTDTGCGFELDRTVDLPVASETDERGRGIALMRLLADSVTICRRTSGRGTCARIVKLIRS